MKQSTVLDTEEIIRLKKFGPFITSEKLTFQKSMENSEQHNSFGVKMILR